MCVQAVRVRAVVDPMAVGAVVGAGDGVTDQQLSARLAALQSSSGCALDQRNARQFEADLVFLLAGDKSLL